VGGRLIPALLEQGYDVRAMARRPVEARNRLPREVELVTGDVFDAESLVAALDGVDVAFFLVHSMGAEGDFESQDRHAATTFADAARSAGTSRIVYLGGLGHGMDLSPHLRSRQEVGRIFRESGVPTLELRASVILGSGSLSYELIRALVEKLPVMITPAWVRVETQPIAIEDVISYLVESVDVDLDGSHVLEVGSPDRMSYAQLMKEYASQRGLRRVMISVPVLTPRLSSLWLGLVTPVYAHVGKKLVDGLRNTTVVTHRSPALDRYSVRPMAVREAIRRAILNEDERIARTRWSDSRSVLKEDSGWGGSRVGTRLFDSRDVWVDAAPAAAFTPIRRIGGEVGWYYGNPLWKLRGFLDTLIGGVGLRRGRRDPEFLRTGDTLDFWRVEAYEPDRCLRLRAEMKVPGRAWLQFEIGAEEGGSRLTQTAIFDASGLVGRLYWYALYPLHELVFQGMLNALARAATTPSTNPETRVVSAHNASVIRTPDHV
jgi:uncharacterized protein YbjT (DUF2867 family)